jgi:hypothetical protein
MYVVEYDGHAVAWCLGQANISRDHCVENLCSKECSKICSDLLRKRRAIVIHRQKNAFDSERRIDGAAKSGERIEQFRDAFQGQELALDRNHDCVCCGQGVQSQDIERGRAIDEYEVIAVANWLNDPP